jgi:HD-GYP domain-containing protein (c-di-GMP phosphodiesterase class II)
MKFRWPMHVQLTTLFVAIFVVIAVATGIQRIRSTANMLDASAAGLIKVVSREANDQLERVIEAATLASTLLARTNLPGKQTEQERLELLPLLQEAVKTADSLDSVYAGYGSGAMFMVRRLRGQADEQLYKAPAGTRYMLQSIDVTPRGKAGRFVYLDEQLQILRDEQRPEYAASYDPRTRGWYQATVAAGETVTSEPYVFFTSRKVGLTVSTPAENSRTVVGVDIGLDKLGRLFQEMKATPGSQLALVLPDGRMFAHDDLSRVFTLDAERGGAPRMRTMAETGIPVFQALYPAVQALDQQDSLAQKLEAEGREWRVSISPVTVKGKLELHLVMAVPTDELMAEAYRQRNIAILTASLIVLVSLVAVTWVARRVSTPIRALAAEAVKVQRFDFAEPVSLRSRIIEVDDLAQAMDGMKSTIRRFLTISEAVSSEPNFERLLPLLLGETLAAAGAQAGVLYLEDEGRLQPAAAQLPGRPDVLGTLPALAAGARGELLEQACTAGEARQAPLDDAQRSALGLATTGRTAGPADRELAGALRHGLAVPLLNRVGERVGCLLLMREAPFDAAQASFIKALSGSAASSLETRELINAQRQLFESFIRLIAGAIDAKSPYTGGHCERVPELTKMLARAACEQTSGPFADFQLAEQEWEAVHVASWLHDCGKITTPEFVVDKATKLETIHDRIHEVRTRFEVLKRDAEIACWQAVATGMPEAEARARLAAELAQLDDDYAFVAACNEGGEAMSREDQDRLRVIGARTWLRTLDDRIGISHEEGQRKAAMPAVPLPAVETLLADKPEHRIERRAADRLPPDNPWGFQMEVPELLYDRGELHNLSVARGTLTAEDRYKINEHIVQTVRMLSTLPFPKHLRQVPEIAGGHHEKMDGTGYPKRLARDQMSPVARMMAIADVFEALTAVDRPYKKGKTLSQALGIMGHMRREAHIDPDLFELFLRSGVYLDYARRFLKPEQIDEVDVGTMLKAA